jgi:hypothetical protein
MPVGAIFTMDQQKLSGIQIKTRAVQPAMTLNLTPFAPLSCAVALWFKKKSKNFVKALNN